MVILSFTIKDIPGVNLIVLLGPPIHETIFEVACLVEFSFSEPRPPVSGSAVSFPLMHPIPLRHQGVYLSRSRPAYSSSIP